jgi:hypothetical protein
MSHLRPCFMLVLCTLNNACVRKCRGQPVPFDWCTVVPGLSTLVEFVTVSFYLLLTFCQYLLIVVVLLCFLVDYSYQLQPADRHLAPQKITCEFYQNCVHTCLNHHTSCPSVVTCLSVSDSCRTSVLVSINTLHVLN